MGVFRQRSAADYSDEDLKLHTARFSVISNTTLVVMKLVGGLAVGSLAIISEAIHPASTCSPQ